MIDHVCGGFRQLFLGTRRRQLRKHVSAVEELLPTLVGTQPILMCVSRIGPTVGVVVKILLAKTCSRTTGRRLKLLAGLCVKLLVIIERAQAKSIIDIFLDFPICIVPPYFKMHLIFLINFLEIVIGKSLCACLEVVHGLISFTVRVLAHT